MPPRRSLHSVRTRPRLNWLLATLLCTLAPVSLASAEEAAGSGEAKPEQNTEERLGALERAVEVLTDEQSALRDALAIPEDGEYQAFGGYAPVASKVFFRERGLSIGGYGEVRTRFFVDNNVDDKNHQADSLRAVLYVGYKFNDWIVYNSEFEFEHGGTSGGGSVSTEFQTLDFLLDDSLNVRAGLVLVPMGFINEIHEPVFFYGNERPEVERRIIPSTWREIGAGIYGTIADRVDYRFYAVNGFKAEDFSDNGLRGGRQKGSQALAEHWAFVGRADVTLMDGWIAGGSVYVGNSGQNQTDDNTGMHIPDTRTTIWELHTEFQRYGLKIRGLFAQAHLQDTDELNNALGLGAKEGVAQRMNGGYVSIGYDVLPWVLPESEMSLEPFYRYERLDTQDQAAPGFGRNRDRDRTYHVVGFSFKPIPQVVVKLDYRNIDSEKKKIADEVQFGLGYVF